MTNKIGFFVIVFGMLIILSFSYISFYQHELAHVRINEYFGSDSIVRFGLTSAGVIPIGFESEEKRDFAYVGHSVNEAVSYNIVPLVIMLGVLIVFGFVYLGELVGCVKK